MNGQGGVLLLLLFITTRSIIVVVIIIVVVGFIGHATRITNSHAIVDILHEIAPLSSCHGLSAQAAGAARAVVFVARGDDFADGLSTKGTRRHGDYFVPVIPIVAQGSHVGKTGIVLIDAGVEGCNVFHSAWSLLDVCRL